MSVWSPRSYIYVAIFALAFAWGGDVFADLTTCQNTVKSSLSDCQENFSNAQASKAANVNTASNANAASGGSTPVNSFSLGNTASSGAAADTNASSACKNDMSKCDSDCSSVTDPPTGSKAQAQAAQKQCDDTIKPLVQQLDQSAANLNQNGKDSDKTGQQSSGMPSMPSSPAASPSPTPDPATTPTPTTTPAAATTPAATPTATPTSTVGFSSADCQSTAGAAAESCVGTLSSQCAGSTTSDVCSAFASRYCSASGSSGEASSGASTPGQGIGTKFCTAYLASSSSFSCSAPGASVCPSCTGVAPVAGQTVPDVCANDPAFANPAIASSSLNTASSAGGSSGGGSSGGSSALASAAAALMGQKSGLDSKAEVSKDALAGGSLAVDGAGGGGASSGSKSLDLTLPDFSTGAGGKRGPASAANGNLVASATDIEKQKGASIFQISSEVLLNRCKSGRLLHCATPSK